MASHHRFFSVFASIAIGLLAISPVSAAVEYVIEISVDGLGASYLSNQLCARKLPNFARLARTSAGTFNARSDPNCTETLPNHVGMITGRTRDGSDGHHWAGNSDPAAADKLAVQSVFDVAHAANLRTGLFASKSKFSLFHASYGSQGTGSLDVYQFGPSAKLTNDFLKIQTGAAPLDYAFIHYADPDAAGHGSGWGSGKYNAAIQAVDGYLGQIFGLIDRNPTFHGKTAIILTADHGGTGKGHGDAKLPIDYTIPFFVWAPGVAARADLYRLNPATRSVCGAVPPIRNADGANLALELLRLGPIPGSTANALQDLDPHSHLVHRARLPRVWGLLQARRAVAPLLWHSTKRSGQTHRSRIVG